MSRFTPPPAAPFSRDALWAEYALIQEGGIGPRGGGSVVPGGWGLLDNVLYTAITQAQANSIDGVSTKLETFGGAFPQDAYWAANAPIARWDALPRFIQKIKTPQTSDMFAWYAISTNAVNNLLAGGNVADPAQARVALHYNPAFSANYRWSAKPDTTTTHTVVDTGIGADASVIFVEIETLENGQVRCDLRSNTGALLHSHTFTAAQAPESTTTFTVGGGIQTTAIAVRSVQLFDAKLWLRGLVGVA